MFKQLSVVILSLSALFILCSDQMSDDGRAGRTGSPGEATCVNCHDDFAINSGGGSISIQSPAMTGFQYSPGQTYNMSVTVSKSGVGLFGVGIEALNTLNTNAGTLNITDPVSTQIKSATVSGNSRRNIVHQLNGGASSDTKVFNFSWTAPAAGSGNVTFYFAGVAADASTNDNGDYVYNSSQLFTEITCTTPVQPAGISGNTTVCNGASTTYSIAAVAGATSYTWTLPSGWTGSSTTESISVVPNSSGTISVAASNACGTGSASSLPVTVNTVAAVTSSVGITCNGANNGSANVTPSGGTAPYSYQWSPLGGTSASATNLPAGSYVVTITDVNSCSNTSSAVITEPAQIGVTTSSTDASCSAANGTATAIPTGGVGTFTFSWATTPVQTTNPAVNLGAGNYVITVTDANGCTQTASAHVNQPSTLNVSAAGIDVTCNGNSNGKAFVSATGGSPGYTYSWNTNPVQTTDTAINLPPGTYTAIVTDVVGCSFSTNVTIAEPSALIVSAGLDESVCEGSGIPIGGSPAAGGGTSPYTYEWSPSADLSSAAYPNPVASPTINTSYTLTVTDANNCAATSSMNVTVNSVPVATISQSGDSLLSSVGSLYQWLFGGTAIGGAIDPFYVPSQNGNYSVIVTGPNGCQDTSAEFLVSTVGIDKLISENSFAFYPNPASRQLTIHANDNFLNAKLSFLNITGQVVLLSILTNGENKIDLSSIPEGIYFVVISDGDESMSRRLQIIR